MSRCTILLACGWLLFTPPSSTDKSPGEKLPKLLTGLPYEKWELAGSYDTATECTRGKDAMLQELRENAKQTEASGSPEGKELALELGVRIVTLSVSAKCLPIDSLGFKFK
ncbi:MAG TPA: hypothetical protein VGL11_01765 [Candidatus Binatia bacterium]